MLDSVTAEVGEDIFLRHVAELRGEDCTLRRVPTLMERDFDGLAAESSGLQEGLRVFPCVGLDDESAVGRSFNVYRRERTADGGNLLLRPEYVHLPERHRVVQGLHDQEGTIESEMHVVVGLAVIIIVSRLRAWVGTGSRSRGRAWVSVPGEVQRRAVVRAPGEVRARAWVGSG